MTPDQKLKFRTPESPAFGDFFNEYFAALFYAQNAEGSDFDLSEASDEIPVSLRLGLKRKEYEANVSVTSQQLEDGSLVFSSDHFRGVVKDAIAYFEASQGSTDVKKDKEVVLDMVGLQRWLLENVSVEIAVVNIRGLTMNLMDSLDTNVQLLRGQGVRFLGVNEPRIFASDVEDFNQEGEVGIPVLTAESPQVATPIEEKREAKFRFATLSAAWTDRLKAVFAVQAENLIKTIEEELAQRDLTQEDN